MEAAKSGLDFSQETHWEKAAKTRMGKYLTKMETQFINNTINLSTAKTLMDVGAEAGRFSSVSLDGTLVISIDLDSYGLQRLKLETPSANVIQADARNIPLRNDLFNVIFMIEVLDYISESDEVFAECYRTLQPGGSLVVSFGNKSSIKSRLRETRGKSYQHSYRDATDSLLNAGFKFKRQMGYNWMPFGRMSENLLIPLFVFLEKTFALRNLPRYSPWVIVHATKPD